MKHKRETQKETVEHNGNRRKEGKKNEQHMDYLRFRRLTDKKIIGKTIYHFFFLASFCRSQFRGQLRRQKERIGNNMLTMSQCASETKHLLEFIFRVGGGDDGASPGIAPSAGDVTRCSVWRYLTSNHASHPHRRRTICFFRARNPQTQRLQHSLTDTKAFVAFL